MNISDLIQYIETVAPLSFAAEWDKSGVQVASFQEEVTHIAVMLDPTLESITAGIEVGADFMLAHHPLAMQARFPDTADAYFSVLSLLIRNNICLYSAHTSLDANTNGPSGWLATALGLENITALEAGTEGPEHGYGFVGSFSQGVPYSRFRDILASILSGVLIRGCGPVPSVVHRVACCPGSGSSLLPEAQACNADVFITGDVKYHTALDTPLRILDVGHFCLEEEMMRLFSVLLAKDLGIAVTFIPAEDPFALEYR